MNEQEYTESNELISDFMELRVGDGYHRHPSPARGTCKPQWLQYHHNWGWLMLVIDKLDSLRDKNGNLLCQTTATSHIFHIKYESLWGDNRYDVGLHRPEGMDRITNVYLAVVDFIKWYNQLNK